MLCWWGGHGGRGRQLTRPGASALGDGIEILGLRPVGADVRKCQLGHCPDPPQVSIRALATWGVWGGGGVCASVPISAEHWACAQHCPTLSPCVFFDSFPVREDPWLSQLQMGPLRPREVKWLARRRTARKWQTWALTLGECSFGSEALTALAVSWLFINYFLAIILCLL